MGDTQEIASTQTTSAPKPTPRSLVAGMLRRHPSKPSPVNASELLRSAVGLEAPADDRAGPQPDRHGANHDEIAVDAIGPARGIAFGLALMVPFWGAVGLAIHALLR